MVGENGSKLLDITVKMNRAGKYYKEASCYVSNNFFEMAVPPRVGIRNAEDDHDSKITSFVCLKLEICMENVD